MDNQQKHCKKEWGEDVFTLLSWFKTAKVRNAKVMVAGAGALGNEVLKNLALFGIGHILVVDFDTIEYSNLTRSVLFRPEDADKGYYKAEIAAKRIHEINPSVHIEAICGNLATDVGLGVYRRMDVVVGCLDSLLARMLLNRQCFRAGKPWVEGGIGDLEGQVSVYQLGKCCFECSLSEEEKRIAYGKGVDDDDNRISCPGIVQVNEKRGRVATTPVSASIIGAIQAQEAMKIIHQEETDAGHFTPLIGKMFHYGGAHPNSGTYDFDMYNDDCFSHDAWDNIVEIPELSADLPVSEAIHLIKKELQTESAEINLLNDKFVDKISARSDSKTFYPMLPESKLSDYISASKELEYYAMKDDGLYQKAYDYIDDEFPYQSLTLKQIGIPYLDVLQVTTEKGYFYVELAKDKDRFKFLF